VIQAVPFIGNAAYAYSAYTGRDWMTGAPLTRWDQAAAFVGAALPMAGIVGGVKAGLGAGRAMWGLWQGWTLGDRGASRLISGIRASESVIALVGGDGCTAMAAGTAAAASHLCGRYETKVSKCLVATGLASFAGNLPQVEITQDGKVKGDSSARLEYGIAEPNSNQPPSVKSAIGGLINGLLK